MEVKESCIKLAIVGGTFIDLISIDLSPWGIKGALIQSKEAEEYIRTNSKAGMAKNNLEHLKSISQSADGKGGVGMHGDWEYMNLLWPIDINTPPTEEDYFEAIDAIKVIHPSELHIRCIMNAQHIDGQGFCLSSWTIYNNYHWSKYKEPRDQYFMYPDKNLGETNEFLLLYKEKYMKRDYIHNAIKYYLESFNVNALEMSFICLCICLETVVPGNEQVTYRFRRNLAVLCADSYGSGKKIYKNARLLYEYRSKLVHSGMKNNDFTNFELFFKYAQILASRMIVEMLLHDMPSIDDLDKKLTELGFGQGNMITEGYKPFQGNIITWFKVSEYEI